VANTFGGYLARAAVMQPEKLDHEPLLPFFLSLRGSLMYVSYFQSRFFTFSGRNFEYDTLSLFS
jgi:hypothetical protein